MYDNGNVIFDDDWNKHQTDENYQRKHKSKKQPTHTTNKDNKAC